jgi:hypothetical protein
LKPTHEIITSGTIPTALVVVVGRRGGRRLHKRHGAFRAGRSGK